MTTFPACVLVLPGSAQMIRFGIQKRVQRLLDRRSHHLVQVLADAPFVNLPTGPNGGLASPVGPTSTSMVGSIVPASEVSLLLLVPTSQT